MIAIIAGMYSLAVCNTNKNNFIQSYTDGTCMHILLSAAYVHTQLYKVCDEDLIPASNHIILHSPHSIAWEHKKARKGQSSSTVQEYCLKSPGWWVNIPMQSMYTYLKMHGILMTVRYHKLLNLVQYQVRRMK